jgi:hypothetical protein
MPGASPTSLSLRYLREQGWLAQVVERWIPTRDPETTGRRDGFILSIAELRAELLTFLPMGLSANAVISCIGRLERAMPAAVAGSPGRRVDLFGIIDIICLDSNPGCLGVQCCADSGVSKHLKEIREGIVKMPAVSKDRPAYDERKLFLAREWISKGNRLWVIGWKIKDRKWTPRVVNVTAETLGG